MIDYLQTHWDTVTVLFVQHLQLCGIALGIAFLIAIPLGILLSRVSPLYAPVMGVLGAIYTIPSLALFALLVPLPFVGGIGTVPAITALVLYAQFILVRNITVGLRGVDRTVVEAARGMGMSPAQILWRVELPLALPVIVAGVRIATVVVIGVATVATYIAAGGLGDILHDGIQKQTNLAQGEIEAGALLLAVLAIGADVILRTIEYLAARSAGRTAAPSPARR